MMQSPASSSSVSVSRAENAFKHVTDAIQLFDQIFIEVAPVNGYNDPNVGKEVKIPQTNLTDKQCNLIKEISGHLIGIRNNLLRKSGSEPLTPAVEQRIVQDSSATVHMVRQYNLLKDYLIAELNKSEIASNNLKVKEEELVIITAERDKLKKKLANITANGGTYHTTSISTNVSSSSLKNTMKKETELILKCDVDPSCYVGGFIRKPFGSSYFFGLIASYDEHAGYYQLVYEDADFEDLTFTEMKRVLWSGATPTAKREACMKHAKLLNKLTDEECMQLAETYNATNGVGIVVGTGRTRKPSLSNSSTTSSSGSNSGSTTSSSSSRKSNGNQEDIIEITSSRSSTGSSNDNTKTAVEDIPVATVTDGENSNGSDIPHTSNTTSSSSNSSTSTQLPQKQKDVSSSIATVRAMIKSATTTTTDTTRTTATNLTTTSTTTGSNPQQISTPAVTSTTTTTTEAVTATAEAAETGTSNLLLLQKLVKVNAAIAPSPPAALSCVVGDSKERPKSKAKDSASVKTTTTTTTTSIAAVAIPRNALTDKVRAKNTTSTPTATTTSTTPTTTPSASQVNTINDDSDDSSVVFIGSNPSPHSAQPTTTAVVNLTSSTKVLTQSVRVSNSSSSSSKLQSTDSNRATTTAGKRRLEEESEFTVVQVASKRVAK